MKCVHCQTTITEADLVCPACDKTTARTREDLQRTDPRINKTIAWSLIGMGVFGLLFVIANSWTDWYSGLDYVAPVVVLVVGLAALFTTVRKK
jgi:hypothetical protein